jgi:predicted nucleic acid-binding protein
VILVDTSVWIDLFRDRTTPPATRLRDLLDERREIGVTPLIVQEILQGAADEREFILLNDYFPSQRMLLAGDPLRTHCQAARLYVDCRRRGFAPRSTIDCFIAQIAIEHGVPLLHADGDFERIAKVAPDLKFV